MDSAVDDKPKFIINAVRRAADLEAVIKLFREYAAWLNLDLSFQSFEEELASMPGAYVPSERGELILARDASTQEAIGCVALRNLPSASTAEPGTASGRQIGEIKRLYTVPSARGTGLGRALVNRVVEIARDLAYDELKLDTLPSMTGALRLYESVGFVDVEVYRFNPVPGARFLGLNLNTGK